MQQCPRGGNVCLSADAVFSKVAHLVSFSERGRGSLYSWSPGVTLLSSGLPPKVQIRQSCCFLHCSTQFTLLQREMAFFLKRRGTVPGETTLELQVSTKRYIVVSTNIQSFVCFPAGKIRNYSSFLPLIWGRAKRVILHLFFPWRNHPVYVFIFRSWGP